jgi:hypothetical protein
MIFNNKTIEKDFDLLKKNKYTFKKGNISGNSIEFIDDNSYTSYVYYDDDKSRDEDYEKLIKNI